MGVAPSRQHGRAPGPAQGGRRWPGGPGGAGHHSGLSCPSALWGRPGPRLRSDPQTLSVFLFQDSGPNKVSGSLGFWGGIVALAAEGSAPLPAKVSAAPSAPACALSLRAQLRARPCGVAGEAGDRQGTQGMDK